ncbi:CCAAT-binding factor [Forsythia ovata]|uniref:CCAAT-binding factor n=1 Tax=Forsythia ovata TaxID=205694 RepID=A0ABD1ST36_9LAMI
MGAIKASKTTKDIDHLKSDVASFASSLGFSSAPSSSGFNDSDFRKTGSLLKPHYRLPKNSYKGTINKPHEKENKEVPRNNNKPNNPKLNLKSAQIQTRNFSHGNLLKEHDNKFKNLPKLPLLKASAVCVWYKDAALLEEKVIGDNKRIELKNVDEWNGLVEKKKELGERLMAQSGTAADKVSAFSVLVGDNPVANLRSIDMLLGMVTSKIGKRHALAAFEALKELFISSLLPDRKLKTLVQQPLNQVSDTKDGYSLLLFWYWEECLKESKSEQERCLLSALVNKVLISESGEAASAAKHSKDDKKSSSSLKENKIIFRIAYWNGFAGVNRAFPFVSDDEADDVIEVQTPMLFQLVCLGMLGSLLLGAALTVHPKNFNVGVQALMLLDKISSKNQESNFHKADHVLFCIR